MYKNILCALDLSDASKKVLERAVQVAKNNGAKLYLFHNAVKLSDIYSGVMNVDFSKTEEAGFQIATEQLERLNDGLYPNTEIIVDSGDFINNLNEGAVDKDCELLPPVGYKLYFSYAVPLYAMCKRYDKILLIISDDSILNKSVVYTAIRYAKNSFKIVHGSNIVLE